MPNCVTDGVGPPMTPHQVLLKFHPSLLGSLSGLVKLVQRHITLHNKGTPCLLKIMCLEHLDHALIHRLQQRCGVRQQEDELDVLMQVLQHVGVGGTIIQDHQDMEGEALKCAILLQLVHQGRPAVGLENVARHPTTGTSEPMDRQAGLSIALECTRVLSVVDQDRLELAVSQERERESIRLAPSRRVKWSLNALKPGADFSSLMMYVWSGIFFHCRPVSSMLSTCWGLYPPPPP